MAAILPSFSLCCETDFCTAPVTVSVPGPPGSVGPAGPSAEGGMVGWFLAQNLDAALLIPASAINTFMIMLGGEMAGDTFGGNFFWDPLSVALHDYTYFGGSVINPFGNSGAGRWIRF